MKNFVLSGLLVLLMAGGAFASPLASGHWTDYEYYQSASTDYTAGSTDYPGENLVAGDTRSFFFDLKSSNPGFGTDSTLLRLKNDVDGYTLSSGIKPLTKAWASVTLFSVDNAADQFNLDVTATFNGTIYSLGSTNTTVGNSTSTNTGTFTFDFAGALLDDWKANPAGLVKLSLGDISGNDFNLLEVGVGASPVPEPGTLLLLGVGLIGLAYLKRRKEA